MREKGYFEIRKKESFKDLSSWTEEGEGSVVLGKGRIFARFKEGNNL